MKFEYKIESLYGFGITKKVEELNKWGSAGWEVCGLLSANQYETNFLFKREIPGESDKEWESEFSRIDRVMKAAGNKQRSQEKCS